MHLVLSLILGLCVSLVFLAATDPRKRGGGRAAAAPPEAAAPPAWAAVDLGRAAAGAIVGLAAGVATQLLLGWPAFSLAAGAVAAWLPGWARRRRAGQARDRVADAVAQAASMLAEHVRLGQSVEAGIVKLAESGPKPLRTTFRVLAEDLRISGSEAEAFARARQAVGHRAFSMLCIAVLMSYRVGGRNLSTILDGVAQSTRDDAASRRQVRALHAEHVMSARVIMALPVVLILTVRATNPDYLGPFATPAGQVLLAYCLVSICAGYAAMLRLIALPGQAEVLR